MWRCDLRFATHKSSNEGDSGMNRSMSKAPREVPHIGLDLHVETPENVLLAYQLAGPSVRSIAYLLDLIIRVAFMWVLTFFLTPLQVFFPGTTMGFLFVVWFLNGWGYYVACEGFFKGKSFGKHVMGLRVIQEGGYPITFWPSVLRNFVRAADGMPFFLSGVGFTTMLLSKNLQRLGDLAARTVVITERPVVLPEEPIILEKITPLERDVLGGFVPDEKTFSAIEHFLGRRNVVSHGRGHQLASILAGKLADRLNYSGDALQVREYPMAFLARIYVTFLERRDDDHDRHEAYRPSRVQPTSAAGNSR